MSSGLLIGTEEGVRGVKRVGTSGTRRRKSGETCTRRRTPLFHEKRGTIEDESEFLNRGYRRGGFSKETGKERRRNGEGGNSDLIYVEIKR